MKTIRRNPILSLIAGIVVILTTLGCDDNNRNLCVSLPIDWADPYESPIWHPNGQLIGFNHTPLRKRIVDKVSGCPDAISYQYDFDSTGFWTINIDGTGMKRILPYYLLSPSWSPDGNWIAYVKGTQIFRAPFDGNEIDTDAEVQLTTEGRNFFPTWSPDGQWLAFDSDVASPTGLSFVWTMKQDGSEKVRIAYTPTLGETRMPSWGSSLIAHVRYIGNAYPELFTMNTDGTNPDQVTNRNQFLNRPSISPVSTKIGFIGTSSATGKTSIWLCEPNTKSLNEFLIGAADFSWSNDGKIVYVKHLRNTIDNEYGALWTINADGSNNVQLTKNNYSVQVLN